MPPARSAKPKAANPVLLAGDDDFAAKERARQILAEWVAEWGDNDRETINATVANSAEALNAIHRLREAMQTLPFFGGGKIIWLQDCNFLGEDRTASSQAVSAELAQLAQELKDFDWTGVRLLINAGKVDKRKTFYKTLAKIGLTETYAGLSPDDRDWLHTAEDIAARRFKELGKQPTDEALTLFVTLVGPNSRLLHNEAEKVALYTGATSAVTPADINTIVSRNKQSRAFALGDALGRRDIKQLMQCLDEELWEMKLSSQKSEIGLLYGLISKVRSMLFAKELLAQKWIRPEASFSNFKAQLEDLPTQSLPADKRFNPAYISPYVLYTAAQQCRHYSMKELVDAMETLLRCNEALIFSSLEGALLLQQALIRIVTGQRTRPSQTNAKAA